MYGPLPQPPQWPMQPMPLDPAQGPVPGDMAPMPQTMPNLPDQNDAAKRYARKRLLYSLAAGFGKPVQAGQGFFGGLMQGFGGAVGGGLQAGQMQHEEEQKQAALQAQQANLDRTYGLQRDQFGEEIRSHKANEANAAAAAAAKEPRQMSEMEFYLKDPAGYKKYRELGRAPMEDYVPTVDEPTLNALADAAAAGMPSPIRSTRKEGIDLNMRILQRAIQRHPDVNFAGATAQYKSLSGALGTFQRGYSATEGFGDAARRAMGVVESTLDGLPETGTMPGNALLRGFKRATGDTNVTKFDNARQVVNTELARILQQGFLSNGSQLTDSMRHELQQGMHPNATTGQIRAALGILNLDLQNKLEAGASTISGIRRQIGDIPDSGRPTAPSSGFDPNAARAKYGY